MSSRLSIVVSAILRSRPVAATVALGLVSVALTGAPATAAAPAAVHAAASNPSSLSAAQALSQAKQTGKPVPATGLTDMSSQTTANPDGTLTRTQSNAPVRTRRHGSWVNLDPTLTRNANGTYSPAATTATVTLSSGGAGPLAVLGTDGDQLSLTVPMSLPAPTVSGATATYPNVLPDVDLVVTIDEQGGFSDTFVVKTPAAAANPALASLRMTTTGAGLTTTADSAGDIAVRDVAGQSVYTGPTPMMWDSASTAGTGAAPANSRMAPSTVDGPSDGAHEAPVGIAAAAGAITLTPAQSLLTASSTVYPVYIDPVLNPDPFGGAGDWTEVESGDPNYAGWHQSGPAQEGDCGWNFCDGIGTARSYFQWGITPLFGTRVISSQVNFTETYSPTCTLPQGTDGTVALEWTSAISSATSWNNQPGQIHWTGWNDPHMYGFSSGCPAHGIGTDVTSEMTQEVNDGSPTITFGLFAEAEADKYGWKQFSNTATMSTTYDVTPATPTGPYTSPVMSCTTTQPYPVIGKTDLFFYIQTPEARDNVAKPLSVEFRVTNLASGASPFDPHIDTTAGAGATTVAPQGTFANGDYSWTAQSYDGLLTSAWSTPCDFHVDTSQPGPPTISSPNQTAPGESTGVVGQPVGFTFNPGTGSSTPAAYQYQVNSGVPVRVNATNGAWTGTITPTRTGPSTVDVQALSAAGTPSISIATWQIVVSAPTPLPPDGDFTYDGHPDLLTVGGTAGMPPGLWLASGDGAGHVANVTDIGALGNGFSPASASPADWNGAIVAHGRFTGDGLQDVLAVFPPPAGGTQVAEIYTGNDTSALDTLAGNESTFPVGGLNCFTDESHQCLGSTDPMTQVTTMGRLPENSCVPDCDGVSPDVFAVVNVGGRGELWWYQGSSGIGDFAPPMTLDSGTDWLTKTISGTTVNGQPALAVRDNATGVLTLYETNCTQNCVANWFTDATKVDMTVEGGNPPTTAANAPVISVEDANGDGKPDLWTVDPNGGTGFLAGTATILGAPTSAGTVIAPAPVPLGAVRWQNPPPVPPPGDHTAINPNANETDVYATDASGNLWQYQREPSGFLGAAIKIGTGNWNNYTTFGIVDWNGDGYPDLVLRNNSTCDLDMFAGSGTGFAATPTQVGAGWCGFTPFGVEDWNHDHHYDVIARSDADGLMWLYPGDLTGGGGPRSQIGSGWTAGTYDPFGIIDFNGDTYNDIMTSYTPTDILKLYAGDGAGGGYPNDGAWVGGGFDHSVFVGMLYYDGPNTEPQMITRQPSGDLLVYTGNGTGGWSDGDGRVIAYGW